MTFNSDKILTFFFVVVVAKYSFVVFASVSNIEINIRPQTNYSAIIAMMGNFPTKSGDMKAHI